MARLLSLALIVGLLPSGLAGPACAQKYKNAADCISTCNQRWGYAGLMMGTNSWGSTMKTTGSTENDWNSYIANACGEPLNSTDTSSSSSASSEPTGLVKALGTQPAAVTTTSSSSSSSSTSTTSSTHSTSSTSSTTSTSSTHSTTSTTTSHTTSTTHTTTSTPKPTTTSTTRATTATTQAKPTTTTAQAVQTTAASSSSSSSGDGSNGSDASSADVQAYLQAHNSVRSQHGAVPVTWSNDAASKAQFWANKCTNTHSGGTLGPFGENLAAGTGSFGIAQAVGAWAAEVSEYNANDPVPSHFTQMVWKATTEIGCAVATCNGIFAGFGAAQYYVCEYSVQGNVIGDFAANVQA
ncbi:PR-1-like protein [Mycena maculata]|uniref:PR-1-like protein n=1 Tax=Mycena maculata TaxID=230809 RepID=A0AAD7P191_9AGAR|nr:PR-1-like protein [Mycena maculata]